MIKKKCDYSVGLDPHGWPTAIMRDDRVFIHIDPSVRTLANIFTVLNALNKISPARPQSNAEP